MVMTLDRHDTKFYVRGINTKQVIGIRNQVSHKVGAMSTIVTDLQDSR